MSQLRLSIKESMARTYPVRPAPLKPMHVVPATSVTQTIDVGPTPVGPCTVCDSPSTARCQTCLTTWYCSIEHRVQDLEKHPAVCVPYKTRVSENQRVESLLIKSNKVICVVLPGSRWIACGNMGIFYRDPTTGDRYGLTSSEIVDGGLLQGGIRDVLPKGMGKVLVGIPVSEYRETMLPDAQQLSENTTGRPVYCATWADFNDRANVTRNLEQIHINRRLGVVILCQNHSAIIKVDRDFPELVDDDTVVKAGIESIKKDGSDWFRTASDGVLDYVQHHPSQPQWLYPDVGKDNGLCTAVHGPHRLPKMFFDMVSMFS